MNHWYEEVEKFGIRKERFQAGVRFTDGRIGARANRGRLLSEQKLDALIWGLEHENPVVRRCCLEFLDQHPCDRALPSILHCLNDPVPRVRWHAVHALICDACKLGINYLNDEVLARLQVIAENDPSPKVRKQAIYGLEKIHCASGCTLTGSRHSASL